MFVQSIPSHLLQMKFAGSGFGRTSITTRILPGLSFLRNDLCILSHCIAPPSLECCDGLTRRCFVKCRLDMATTTFQILQTCKNQVPSNSWVSNNLKDFESATDHWEWVLSHGHREVWWKGEVPREALQSQSTSECLTSLWPATADVEWYVGAAKACFPCSILGCEASTRTDVTQIWREFVSGFASMPLLEDVAEGKTSWRSVAKVARESLGACQSQFARRSMGKPGQSPSLLYSRTWWS